MNTLSAHKITLNYHKKCILNQVSLSLHTGELVILLGVNGAGKSTLLRVLSGILEPQSGLVSYDDDPIHPLSPAKRAKLVSLLHQDIPYCTMTVLEFVLLGVAPYLHFGQIPNKTHHTQAQNIMEQLSLLPLQNRPMNQLSGGERQRAALAQCLMTNATFLLLDEPTASLDVRRQHEFLDLLTFLVQTEEKGALVSVHDPNLALDYASSVAVLSQNQLIVVPRRQGWEHELEHLLHPDYSSSLVCSPSFRFHWTSSKQNVPN